LRKFLRYNRLAILWGLLIVLLLSLPGKIFPKVPDFFDLFRPDKIIHLVLFGVYIVLQVRGFRKQDSFPEIRKHAVLISLMIGFLLGAFTELLQRYWIPMRIGSMYDLAADMAGCLLGWWTVKKK